MGGSLLRSRVFDRFAAPEAPLTLQYPGVQVIIIHPDSEPPLIICEKVGGLTRYHIPLKKDWINQSFFSGADGGSRTPNLLVTNEMLCH